MTRSCFQALLAAASAGLCSVPALHAHDAHEHAEDKFTVADQHAPTPLPDRVVLTWSGDPRSSIDVSWRTQASVSSSVVQIADSSLLRGNLREGDVPGARQVDGASRPFNTDLGTWRQHTASLQDLTPDTMFAYRVGDGQHWSEWHQFRTASEDPKPFTFVYFGDAQNAVRAMWSRVVREANQHAPRSAFMLHAGDLVNRGNRDAEWGEWFGAGGWLNGMIPSIATPGNHEYDDEDNLAGHWRPQFSFPLNGPPGLEETVYWVDFQGARIISLNSNEQVERQTAWLESVLSDPARPKWTFVTFHHPIFSAAKERDNARLRAEWRPVLEKHGVDLVLQGHDHAYARSGLGGPKNVTEGMSGKSSNTVYVVSVSGPKMYELQEKWEVPRVASGVQLFQVIHVSPDEIKYEARLATGELYDSFTLRKGGADQTELIEQSDKTPEIRE